MYQLFATCPNDVVDLLFQEIEDLGGENITPGFGIVYFDANEEVYYKAHLYLRLASRIHRILKVVPAHSPTIIFDKLKRIRYHELFSADHSLAITVLTSPKESKVLTHLVGSKIREAVSDSFRHYAQKQANLSSRDPQVTLVGYLDGNKLMLSLDTSMMSLHMRGYRLNGHPSPLKENLAAALLRFCNYKGEGVLFDPMCGSATIVIEAALMALGRSPHQGEMKRHFGLENLQDFNKSLWAKLRSDANIDKNNLDFKIFASDIEQRFIDLGSESAKIAQVDKVIEFFAADFFTVKKPADSGLLIANIPYGHRLETEEIDIEYLQKLGDHLKSEYKGWTCGILLPISFPYKFIGLRPSKKKFLKNGAIDVVFLVFEIF